MPSQITTHILDTALGKPAEGVKISLQKADGTEIASGNTNADGRISNLLGDDDALEPGVYKMVFQTGEYYKGLETKTFYPEVTVMFETFDKINVLLDITSSLYFQPPTTTNNSNKIKSYSGF